MGGWQETSDELVHSADLESRPGGVGSVTREGLAGWAGGDQHLGGNKGER